MAEEEAAPGRLAFLLFIQLEAEAADEALLSQATKNLVFLAPRLLAADAAAGRVPDLAAAKPGDAASLGNGNAAKSGVADGDDAGVDDVDAEVDDDEGGDGAAGGGLTALTLHGLIRWDLHDPTAHIATYLLQKCRQVVREPRYLFNMFPWDC